MKGTLLLVLALVLSGFVLDPLEAQEPSGAVSTAEAPTPFQKAMKLYRERKYSEAIQEFHRIVEMEPQNAAAWYFMGYAHYVMNHHQESVLAFEKAFEVNPEFDPRPYFLRR